MINVFIEKIPDKITGQISCKLRLVEIESCKSEKVKRQKTFAWLLLENCAKKLGFQPENIEFSKTCNGKWNCDKFSFSISHSENYVAVAISDCPIGIDLQKDVEINSDSLAKKILQSSELVEFNSLLETQKHDFVLEKWTQKESIYKMEDVKYFKFENILTSLYNVYSTTLNFDKERYFLSVASKDNKRIEIKKA